VRLLNLGSDVLPVPAFADGETAPVLTDEAGKTYRFVEARRRIPDKQKAVFDAKAPLAAELAPTMQGRSAGWLLIFERPAAGSFEQVKLELPAAAWSRTGKCRFRLDELFERTGEGINRPQ